MSENTEVPGTMKTVSLFVKATLARMKGDTDEAMALNNQRKGIVVCKQELANLEAAKFHVEERIVLANENLLDAKYPTESIDATSKAYLLNIQTAKGKLESVEEEMEDIEFSIKETTEILEELGK